MNYCSSHEDAKGEQIFSNYKKTSFFHVYSGKKYSESKETDSNPTFVTNYGNRDKSLDHFTSFSSIKWKSYVFGTDMDLYGGHPPSVLLI